MTFRALCLILVFSISLGCGGEKENKERQGPGVTTEVQETAQKESTPRTKTAPVKNVAEDKPADSIDNKNTIPFLQKYGELNPETRVVIRTRLGDIGIKLYEDTPLHRASFVFLTKVGYFDTTCFYRVVPDFIIQGGESERLDTQRYKARYMRYKIPSEFRPNRKHKYGAVALARDWVNNPQKKSTAFEFYIVQNRKGAHHLDGEHTVFGEVTYGFETIDRIVSLEAGSDEWPLEDVFMKVEVVK